MKLHPGYEWHIFHNLTSEDIADVIPLFFLCFFVYFLFYFRNTHLYVIKRKLHVGLKIWSLSFAALTREISFPLEDKLHIFAPPCNNTNISRLLRELIQYQRGSGLKCRGINGNIGYDFVKTSLKPLYRGNTLLYPNLFDHQFVSCSFFSFQPIVYQVFIIFVY